MDTLTPQQVETEQLSDWRMLFNALHARFRTGDFATGLRLVDAIGQAAEEMNHHPDLELTYGALAVRLTSHDAGGVTGRDVRLARTISELAATEQAVADPASTQVLELALDTEDAEAIKPFWRAVLAMSDSASDDELVDPMGRLPTLWFQQTTAHETPRQRFHLDVRVPPEEAEARVAAALEAGGTLVGDDRAPRFWVLADAQGNRACVTTWQDR
ncbi:4a-hydroxytetrahydrobiopterin dehydratase [Nocardioides sp.]|uniref:4a-hydroxytetrahydrobiopterin dehydratase n=1 Tax=Nocardioides sp. TaxID=35761 RepID=UPI003563DDA7